MKTYWLQFRLLSDATFGRGEGLAGVVDQEVDHDVNGLPYLRGRALKGLLNEECANLLFALNKAERWTHAAQRLFGEAGSLASHSAQLHVGDARLPADLRAAVAAALADTTSPLRSADILESLTTIRHQTAVGEVSGAPDNATLRAMRVVVRGAVFEAPLIFQHDAEPADLQLLAACAMSLRRAGTGRNRGRGRLQATLHADDHGRPGEDLTPALYRQLAQEVRA